MGSKEPPKSRQYDECRYLARSLAVSLQDLDAQQRSEVLSYLSEELQRLSSLDAEEGTDLEGPETADRLAITPDLAGRGAGA
jgi:hypothetical protein